MRLKADTDARFTKVDERDREMESWYRAVNGFRIDDGKWKYLGDNLRASADAMLAYRRSATRTARSACGDLALGESHPKVASTIKMLSGRVPTAASHRSKHDSQCQGVRADGICTQGDQCLDGGCTNHRCERCPSNADGQCHPPGTCSDSDYRYKYATQKQLCDVPFKSSPYRQRRDFPCAELEQRCNAARQCLKAKLDTMTCFKGGDSRHHKAAEEVQKSLDECWALLKEKRDLKECS